MFSPLQKARLEYKPRLPKALRNPLLLEIQKGEPTQAYADIDELKKLFEKSFSQPIVSFVQKDKGKEYQPVKIGVVFSGGQAAGGHNVIAGLFDALKTFHPNSDLIGFANGPSGIIDNKTIPITEKLLASYRNQGGFDLLGSGRTKIETDQQLQASLKTAKDLSLDGIVIIGGDDSNTNAAILAEYFLKNGCSTKVIGVPKTIDGDLQNEYVDISFGFDTACKTYAEMIGNIARDSLSAKKYYHFVKLMGRSASHIALECALKTQPNMVIIAEEVADNDKTLKEVTKEIADLICKRAESKKNYGIILIPEGLIEFIPEIKLLISELNSHLSESSDHFEAFNKLNSSEDKIKWVFDTLSNKAKTTFSTLPKVIQEQLLLDRDPHGNVQVSKIETEKLLLETVKKELKNRKDFKGKFNAQCHFFGYEGRAGLPSNFDAEYCYALGFVATLLVYHGLTGYMSCVSNLTKPIDEWEIKGLPITMMMNMEMRKGKKKPVIKKALVDLKGKAFQELKSSSEKWQIEDLFICPGPIQFFGDSSLIDVPPLILTLKSL